MTDNNRKGIGEAKINAPAPDALVYNEAGQQVKLSSLWENGPTLLVFVRHFG